MGVDSPFQEGRPPAVGVLLDAAGLHDGVVNPLVQWNGLEPDESGFVALSIVEFTC